MKTVKQIRNAYDRAADKAHRLTVSSQVEFFAATGTEMSHERGASACAAGAAAQALALLENGNYEGFLTNMRLAGEFAATASNDFYARKVPAAAVNPPLRPRIR